MYIIKIVFKQPEVVIVESCLFGHYLSTTKRPVTILHRSISKIMTQKRQKYANFANENGPPCPHLVVRRTQYAPTFRFQMIMCRANAMWMKNGCVFECLEMNGLEKFSSFRSTGVYIFSWLGCVYIFCFLSFVLLLFGWGRWFIQCKLHSAIRRSSENRCGLPSSSFAPCTGHSFFILLFVGIYISRSIQIYNIHYTIQSSIYIFFSKMAMAMGGWKGSHLLQQLNVI